MYIDIKIIYVNLETIFIFIHFLALSGTWLHFDSSAVRIARYYYRKSIILYTSIIYWVGVLIKYTVWHNSENFLKPDWKLCLDISHYMTTDELMGGSNLCGEGVGVCAPLRILKTLFFFTIPLGKLCLYL